MRRLLVLVLAGSLVAWLWRRKSAEAPPPGLVSVRFEDGSTQTLADGSPERDRLVAAAQGLV